MTGLIDTAADLLNVEKRGFFIVQYQDTDGADGQGAQMRYKGNYRSMLGFLVAIADTIMNEYVEEKGYIVHQDMRMTLDRTIDLNEKRPNDKLFNETVDKLREIFSKVEKPEEKEDDDGELSDVITALRCCAECNCKDCPRFTDEDGDGENKYTTLCSEALMTEAAEWLEMTASK